MARPIYVDTNAFLRFIVGDEPSMADECRRLIERAETGEFDLHTSQLAVAEIVWTLSSHYRLSRRETADTVLDLLSLRSVRVDQKDMLRSAVELYGSLSVDFIDAYHAMDARRRGLEPICSYDRDLDKLGAERVDPGTLLA